MNGLYAFRELSVEFLLFEAQFLPGWIPKDNIILLKETCTYGQRRVVYEAIHRCVKSNLRTGFIIRMNKHIRMAKMLTYYIVLLRALAIFKY